MALDHLVEGRSHTAWIAIVFIAVEEEKAVVALSNQSPELPN
jgi:hypothetical protein